MSKRIIARNEEIVIGVDVSEKAHHAAVVRAGARGEIVKEDVLKPRYETWRKYLAGFPGCKVTVVYEAGPHGYNLYDAIKMLGSEAVVIAPVKHLGIKTDRRDARMIAGDFLAGRARKVSVPDYDKRVRRQVLRLRNQLKKDLVRTKNRSKAMRRFHGLIGQMNPWRTGGGEYLEFCLAELELIETHLKERIAETERALDKIAAEPRYEHAVEKLKLIKGIGTLTALEVTLGVANIGSFAHSEAFASYTGLCPGERSSGESRRQGRITRSGPGRLRGVLVQCAWIAVRHDPEEKKKFQELKSRIGARRAIVAVARRLAVKTWRSLKEIEAESA